MFALLDRFTEAKRDEEKLMKTPLRQLSWSSYCDHMIPVIKRYTIMMLKEMNRVLHYHQSSFGGDRAGGYDVKRMDNNDSTIDISQLISQLQDDDIVVPNDIPPIIDVYNPPTITSYTLPFISVIYRFEVRSLGWIMNRNGGKSLVKNNGRYSVNKIKIG
jgi:hypothetical protein